MSLYNAYNPFTLFCTRGWANILILVLLDGEVEAREKWLTQYSWTVSTGHRPEPLPSEFLVHPFCYMVLHLNTLFLMSYMPNFTLHGQNFKESFKAQKAELRPSPGHPVLLRQVCCFNGLCPDYVIFKKAFLWQKPGLSFWDKRKNSRWDVGTQNRIVSKANLCLWCFLTKQCSFTHSLMHSLIHSPTQSESPELWPCQEKHWGLGTQ